MQRDIRHQYTLAQSPEVVWDYLTKPELLAQWLMTSDIKPVVGHKFQFKTKPKIKLGFDGNIYCEVLEVVPYRKLVYSWKGGMSKEKPSLDSIVTWTLTPHGQGTLLQLEHAGFKGIKNYISFLIMNKGWLKIGKRLSTKLSLPNYDAATA